KVKEGQDFFPLTVNYQERSYAAGQIPGSFFRREGRPGEGEAPFGVLGLKASYSGRIYGVDIAQTAWHIEGCIPLGSFEALEIWTW
ncbi:MAG: hypothetical protein ACTS4X_02120, partial [Candidatus Hodgkinia cicadicola]